jgi:hypothetical protein
MLAKKNNNMKLESELDKQLIADCESVGEDEVRLRLNSNKYSPNDRLLMQTWLNIKESNRNLSFQKKNFLIQIVLLVLTIIILIFTAISVYFSHLSIENQSPYPQSKSNTQQNPK